VPQVTIGEQERGGGVKRAVRTGKLSLIDLAGSERASATMNRGARMKEGANINKVSLLCSFHISLCVFSHWRCVERLGRIATLSVNGSAVFGACETTVAAIAIELHQRAVPEPQNPRAVPQLEAHATAQGFARRQLPYRDDLEHQPLLLQLRGHAQHPQVRKPREGDQDQGSRSSLLMLPTPPVLTSALRLLR
jgi:hypothetical protein